MAETSSTLDPYAALLLSGYNNNGFRNNGGDWSFPHNPPEQNTANMALMQSIGQVDKAVAVGTAAMEASQANQSAGIVSQLNSVAGSLSTRIDSTKETVNAMSMVLAQQLAGVDRSVMENRYELAKDVVADGDRTRALITAQYEATLNRQLATANAEIIELRSENRYDRRARESDINVTQTVSQAQTATQTQGQFERLYDLLHDTVQSVRATNQAINFGTGALTASPTNTSTNNSVR